MQAAAVRARTVATLADPPAPKGWPIARLIFVAGLCYVLAEVLFMYSRKHIPLCGCMPRRLILPDGDPDLMIGACLFWFAAGVLTLLSLFRILRGLLGRNPLRWACSALPVEQAVALQLELRRCINDPRGRPKVRTRHHATDALIFLAAAAGTAVVPFAIALSNGPGSVEGDRYALLVVSCTGSSILGLEGLRHALLFLHAWRRVIGSAAKLLTWQMLLRAVAPAFTRFIKKGKRPRWRCSMPLVIKHLAWSAILLPVAHLALLLGTYHFPPADAGYFHHRDLFVLDRQPFGSIYLNRMGVDRRGAVAVTWDEIYAYAQNPDYSQNTLGRILWWGPRWYFRKAWDVSVGFSTKSAEDFGWAEERMLAHASKLKTDLDAITDDVEVTGDELAALVSACDGRFVFTPGETGYAIACNGLEEQAAISSKTCYRYRLTEDALTFRQDKRATRLDCRESLIAKAWIPRAEPTNEMTGWRASLAFALFQIWVLLLLVMAPFRYVAWVDRH